MAIVGVASLTAILLYCMAIYGSIWLAYVGYCLVRVSYQVLMTVASFEIVKFLPEDAFALIFGINTFAAVGVQSLLSLIVNTILGKKISEVKFIYSEKATKFCEIFTPNVKREVIRYENFVVIIPV